MLLTELDIGKDEKKDDKDKKVVFIETDPQQPFPNDTISALEKGINKAAKDLEINWRNPIELVNSVFDDLDVPKPQAFLKKRWAQYEDLLSVAVNGLADSRGLDADWTTTII